ncbi:thiamine pyrophosphate-binding protein [Actinoplanes regularis]|uniref:Acetolactate synthase-1/2/3 large subunit n=1 Tax=Actinoplanes regularis TaxID=52697 RepID=A0A238YB08_9ACTN|nr:thiamine pyrophosphate-binding protein [Actinoplanes regularis]GIE86024.1 putative acetolactate synthase, large subunit [Actinoplanes regularis]SNR68435.1 acetolactate synthase-1/2/3 large subunit [Actinoplanes regularis]
MGPTARVVDHIVAELARTGVDRIFGVGGANIEDLYDAVHSSGGAIHGLVAKHEFAAATMADGYARVTGRMGVVAATSGGGAMNLVPGLAEAHASRVPVLALVGQPPTGLEGRGAFQDASGKAGTFDAREVFAPVSRFCATARTAESLVDLLPRAIAAARSQPRGPAVLLLPKDVQQAAAPATVPGRYPATADPIDVDALERAVAALRAADRTLIIAGEGVAAEDARAELAALARRLGAWVAVTPDAKDVYDNRDSRFVGVAGVMGHPSVMDCLRRADVCLLAGTRLPMLARGGLDDALAGTRVISVDPEPPFVPAVAVRGPVRPALHAIADRLGTGARRCPEHAGPVPLPAPPARGRGTSYAEAVAAVAEALPEDAHVFIDAGNAAATAIHLLPAPRHGRFVVAVGMGGMGYAFGAGIGAALGSGRRTYVLAGDGAFFMHGMEVHTAVEYDAPVTFVVFNNNAHAMCVTREQLFYGDTYTYNMFRPAYLAAGMGAAFPTLDVTRAGNAAQLRRALLRSNCRRGPAFVSLDFDVREIPPFLPFLAALGLDGADRATESKETSDEHQHIHVG